jgi:hypothetical protein
MHVCAKYPVGIFIERIVGKFINHEKRDQDKAGNADCETKNIDQ